MNLRRVDDAPVTGVGPGELSDDGWRRRIGLGARLRCPEAGDARAGADRRRLGAVRQPEVGPSGHGHEYPGDLGRHPVSR